MRKAQSILECAAVILWMLAEMSVMHTLLSPRIAQDDMRNLNHELNLPVAAFNMLANVSLSVLIMPRYKKVLGLFLSLSPIVLFSLLAFASTAWSINPQYTRRRAITFSIGAIAATYFGERYSVNEIGKIVSFAVLGLIGLSLLSYLVNPASVMDISHPGEWMGVAEHKNVFGNFVAFGMCCMALTDFGSLNRLRIPALFLSATMLFLSHSASAWLVFSVIVLAIPPLLRVQRANSIWMPTLLIVGAVSLLSFCLTSSVMTGLLELLGKDPTLTGRTELWQNLIAAIAQRPFLGYGYEAFFSNSSQLLTLQSHATWLPPNAHNGYLQVAVNNGLAGIALALWFITQYIGNALQYARRARSRADLLPVTLGVFWLLHNSVEVTLFEGQTLIAFTIVALMASMRWHAIYEVPERACNSSRPLELQYSGLHLSQELSEALVSARSAG